MIFIEAKDLVFDYIKTDENGNLIKKRALDGIDLTIEKGKFTAIIGQNGSGKSTLAKNMNAILTPTEGSMLVDGMDISDAENVWKVRQRVAMVFQNPDNQIVSAIVEDDVAFGPENLGIESDEIRAKVDAALKSVDMLDYRKKAPHLLSGGQKQRIAIAGAVAMQPECIVFDEPTSMLDPRGRKEVLSTIKDLNAKGITTVLITHFMDEAAMADKVIVMDSGKVVMDGTPQEIFRRADELMELSLGTPPAVELSLELKKRGLDVPDDILTVEEMVDYLCQ